VNEAEPVADPKNLMQDISDLMSFSTQQKSEDLSAILSKLKLSIEQNPSQYCNITQLPPSLSITKPTDITKITNATTPSSIDSNEEIKPEEVRHAQQLLDKNSELLYKLHALLLEKNLSLAPYPSEEQNTIATRISENLAKLISKVPPNELVTKYMAKQTIGQGWS